MAPREKSWTDLSFWVKWGIANAWWCAAVLVALAVARIVEPRNDGGLAAAFVCVNALLLWIGSRIEYGDLSTLTMMTRRIMVWPLLACFGASIVVALASLLHA